MNRALVALPFLFVPLGCEFLEGLDDDEDPLADAELLLTVYPDNEAGSTPAAVEGEAATSPSNRPVMFAFNGVNTLNEGDDLVTKIEVTRVIGGVETTCELLDDTGAVDPRLADWAAASTEYTLTLHAAETTKTFGPIAITVEPAGIAVTGSHDLKDQSDDMITSGGSFFQTRSVDIGFGGYTGPNFNTVLAHGAARLIDFATLTVDGQMLAVSPADVAAIHTFDLLVNDCGWQTTTFAEYTGALDPKTAPLTLEELAALPDPPADATVLAFSEGLRFVYKTSDGKKGLVRVDTLTTTEPHTAGLVFSAEQ